jgi:putative transposase
MLAAGGVRINMHGKGRHLDNIFIERSWRGLKYEDIYIKAYACVSEEPRGIGGWLIFYNDDCLHQSLVIRYRAKCSGRQAPMDIWSTPLR